MDQKVDRFKIPELAVLGGAKKTGARAIVIGSGFGGLAAAIRLAVKGYEVTVLENQTRLLLLCDCQWFSSGWPNQVRVVFQHTFT